MLLPLSASAAGLVLSQPLVAKVVDRLASVDLSAFADNKINENEPTLQIAGASNEVVQDQLSSRSYRTLQFGDAGLIPDVDPSTISSVRIVKDYPDNSDSNLLIATKQGESTDEKVHPVDKIAQFKGGEKELLSFLIENIKYPDSEIESPDNTVKVILSFNILTDGSVDDIKIKRSGGDVFDTEAIEVIKKTSGRWEPAENNGKPVVSQFTIPITFKTKA